MEMMNLIEFKISISFLINKYDEMTKLVEMIQSKISQLMKVKK